MIKIDGNRIKKLREEQGLTQLYMATVVAVTTDTISRWENNRYPAIKKENGEKLAEALGVDLADILLQEEKVVPVPATPPEKTKNRSYSFSSLRLTVTVTAAIAITLVGFLLYSHIPSPFKATRTLPSIVLPNVAFPVFIEVGGPETAQMSLILKETLPLGSEILQIFPATSGSAKNNEVKWIQKIDGTTRFIYLLKINGQTGNVAAFSGSVTVPDTSEKRTSVQISGDNMTRLGTTHWADSDGDNRISDQEILVVFDRYSNIEGLDIDIEQIEEMWLGSHYVWDADNNRITITP